MQSRPVFKKLPDSVSNGFFSLDKDWRFTSIDPNTALFTDFGPEELVGKVIWDTVPPVIGTVFEAACRKCLEDRKGQHVEKQGSLSGRWFSVFIYPSAEGITVFWQDNSCMKRTEAALNECRDRFIAIIGDFAQAMWAADSEGMFSADMPSWRAYTGQSLEECLGYGWLDAIHPNDREYAIRQWKKTVSEGGILNVEYMLRSPECKWRWTNIMAAPIRDTEGRVIKWVGANFDISRRKLAEEVLQESEKKYRSKLEQEVSRRIEALKESRELEQKLARANEELARIATDKYIKLFNSIDEGFCIIELVLDPNGKPIDFRYVEVNPAFGKLTGIHNAEGRLISELSPDLKDFWLELYGRVAVTGKPERYVNDTRINGRWFNTFAFTIDGVDSKNVAVLFSDVTKEIKEKNNMQKALKIQDEVFANISHELKTPLNMIYSTNQLMELYLKNGSLDANSERIARNTAIIRQNCYRFTKLINNIIDMSRMDSGYFKLEIKNENIVEVVKNIVDSISEYVRAKELSIVFDTDIKEKYIECDSEKIERIMLNLISNAIKFTDPGGKIFINVLNKDGFVEIKVSDTGIGIEEKHLNSIFLRYHQVNKSLTRNAEGTGIGLSLVKSIVKMHGGSIGVESKPGVGSTFTVRLPVGNTAQRREADMGKSSDSNANSKIEMINIEFSDIYN